MIAVNPFHALPNLYSNQQQYYGKSLGQLPPHIYAIAENAYLKLRYSKTNQSLIISGESGAGKTETTKYFVNYLINRANTSTANDIKIDYDTIKRSQPLLESFGNAKTSRNNNSSRFGKFLQLNYDIGSMELTSVTIKSFLFERSRVKTPLKGERTFHIFYQMIANLLGVKKLLKIRSLSGRDQHFNCGCDRGHDHNHYRDSDQKVATVSMSETLSATVSAIVAMTVAATISVTVTATIAMIVVGRDLDRNHGGLPPLAVTETSTVAANVSATVAK